MGISPSVIFIMEMTQEEIISYLQIVHQLWIDGWLDEKEVSGYLDEISHEFSVIDPKSKSLRFVFQDEYYPTYVKINSKGEVIVSSEFEGL